MTKGFQSVSKTIAVLTSGGDAPGMNACIRAVVLANAHYGYRTLGYLHGYNGLLNQEFIELDTKAVHNLNQRGGTILHSARCIEFKSDEAGQKAAENLNAANIDALIVIGGDGSFRGAHHLSQFWSGQIIGLPGTIDNDIAGTDATIGYYTAIETAVDSIDKVRDTADAFERLFLVEVMGRHAGFLALSAAVASASDFVILPESFVSQAKVLEDIQQHLTLKRDNNGHVSYVIVVAENVWPGGLNDLVSQLANTTQSEVRPVILGHVQRGGSPVSQDRILATTLGVGAVEAIHRGATGIMIGEQHGRAVDIALEKTWKSEKPLPKQLLDAMKTAREQ